MTPPVTPAQWRTDGPHIRLQHGEDPADTDPVIGTMNDPNLAAVAVEAFNLAVAAREATGRLPFDDAWRMSPDAARNGDTSQWGDDVDAPAWDTRTQDAPGRYGW